MKTNVKYIRGTKDKCVLMIHSVLMNVTLELYVYGHEPLTRYAKLRVAHAPGTFSLPPWVSDPDMHHGTCVKHVPWCMPGSLTSGFLWNRWRGKRSRHSQRMRNPQFCVSGKRPIVSSWLSHDTMSLVSSDSRHPFHIDYTSIRRECVGSMYSRCRSEGFCNLRGSCCRCDVGGLIAALGLQ